MGGLGADAVCVVACWFVGHWHQILKELWKLRSLYWIQMSPDAAVDISLQELLHAHCDEKGTFEINSLVKVVCLFVFLTGTASSTHKSIKSFKRGCGWYPALPFPPL